MLDLIASFAPEGATASPSGCPLVWAALLAIAVAMYVVADGFDLGVGILFNAAGSENWRDRMMLSVAPIWDGNETWLILGGGGLLAVFYLAYAILMPALYIPLIVMLIALIFRGVAFEFRFKADTSKRIWDYAFHYGSLVATFAQGVVLGAFVQGFHVEGRQFAGGTFDWLTPVQPHDGRRPRVGLRAPRRHLVRDEDDGRARDLGAPQGLRVPGRHDRPDGASSAPGCRSSGSTSSGAGSPGRISRSSRRCPLLTAFTAYRLYRALEDGRHVAPFLLAIGLFLLGFLGLAVSLFPYIVPPRFTIWQAANTPDSQLFALVGYAVVMPLTFIYTAYAYYVFRGKVAEDVQSSGYH